MIGYLVQNYPLIHAFQPARRSRRGFGRDGLPIGLQIVGGHLADQTVLRASAASWSLDRLCPLFTNGTGTLVT